MFCGINICTVINILLQYCGDFLFQYFFTVFVFHEHFRGDILFPWQLITVSCTEVKCQHLRMLVLRNSNKRLFREIICWNYYYIIKTKSYSGMCNLQLSCKEDIFEDYCHGNSKQLIKDSRTALCVLKQETSLENVYLSLKSLKILSA